MILFSIPVDRQTKVERAFPNMLGKKEMKVLQILHSLAMEQMFRNSSNYTKFGESCNVQQSKHEEQKMDSSAEIFSYLLRKHSSWKTQLSSADRLP